jgi:hypothetical protein
MPRHGSPERCCLILAIAFSSCRPNFLTTIFCRERRLSKSKSDILLKEAVPGGSSPSSVRTRAYAGAPLPASIAAAQQTAMMQQSLPNLPLSTSQYNQQAASSGGATSPRSAGYLPAASSPPQAITVPAQPSLSSSTGGFVNQPGTPTGSNIGILSTSPPSSGNSSDFNSNNFNRMNTSPQQQLPPSTAPVNIPKAQSMMLSRGEVNQLTGQKAHTSLTPTARHQLNTRPAPCT